MAKTISELKAQSAEVKNASAIGENTATRVGQLFSDIVEHVEQYEINKDGKDASQDAQMQSLVSAEESRAKGEERGLQNQIHAEKIDRQTADTYLSNLIQQESSARETADENIRTALANETARAQAAEQELAAAQIYTAKIKDGAVTTPKIADGAVTYEKTDIIAQELGTNITKVPSQKVVTDAIQKEETERKADVNGLATALASETIQREQGDENLNAAIAAEEEARTLAVSQEAQARSQNDALLNQAIVNETERAEAKEQENAKNIETEITIRHNLFIRNDVELVDGVVAEPTEVIEGKLLDKFGNPLGNFGSNTNVYRIDPVEGASAFEPLFVHTTFSENVAETFSSICIYKKDDDTLVASFRITKGEVTFMFYGNQYAKIAQFKGRNPIYVSKSARVIYKRIDEDIKQNSKAISNEIKRAKAAELVNAQKIDKETTARRSVFIRNDIELVDAVVAEPTETIEGKLLNDNGELQGEFNDAYTYRIDAFEEMSGSEALYVNTKFSLNVAQSFSSFCIYDKKTEELVASFRVTDEITFLFYATQYVRISQFKGRNPIYVSKSAKVIHKRIDEDIKQISLQNTNHWKDKTIIWFGTSIPAQGYPNNVSNILGCKMINKSVGASMVRYGRFDLKSTNPLGDDLGITGIALSNICQSLSMSQEEKRKLFDLWTDDARKAYLISQGYTIEEVANVRGYGYYVGGTFIGDETDPTTGGIFPTQKPLDVWADNGNKYRDMRLKSYQTSWNSSESIEGDLSIAGAIKTPVDGIIEPYLYGENVPDLWIFDHAHNDQIKAFDLECDKESEDRSYFIGAMNFIFRKILFFNPRAKIVIIGNYSNQAGMNGLTGTPLVTSIQEKLASYWQFPIMKLWEMLQFSPMKVTTNGYWDSDKIWHNSGFDGTNHVQNTYSSLSCPENPRQLEDGTWVHDLTLGQIWMQDVLHPSSADAKDYYGKTIAAWLKSNIIL